MKTSQTFSSIVATGLVAVFANSASGQARFGTEFDLELTDTEAIATIFVNSGVPIQSVEVSSDDVIFDDATEVAPGVWQAMGELAASNPYGCYEAAANVVLGTPGKKKGNKCFDSLTIEHLPTGEVFEFDGADIGGNTELEVDGDEGSFHTSCSQCLQIGDTDGVFMIRDLDGTETLAEKCAADADKNSKKASKKASKKSSNKSSKKASLKGEVYKALKKESIELQLYTVECLDEEAECGPPLLWEVIPG